MSSFHSDDRRKSRRRPATTTWSTGDVTHDGDAEETVASAPAEIQLAYEEEEGDSEQRRKTRQARNSATRDAAADDEAQVPNASFQDQLAASALNGTIEFLKVAGGLTLNATGKVVAPPLHVTRTVLLPALWAATVDYLSSRTPKRAKDWLRILSSSVHHFIQVLIDTERGQIFRHRLLLLGGDLLDVLSADTTRQVLIDGMAGFVKFIEALNTPESKAFLDQITILCCRLTQVAASGRSQQAMHDAKSLVWSGVELLSDPRSTTALAEVTAYLCHALEMEDAILDGAMGSLQQKSERRKERDEYQKETVQQKTTLMANPHATVEQVILSSLGGSEPTPGCEESDAFSSHDVQSDIMNSSEGKVFTSDAGSIRKQVEEASSQTDEEWHEQAQKNVNVPFLRVQISKRAERRDNRNEGIPRDIPIVTSVTDESLANNPAKEGDVKETSPLLTEGEDAMDRFYRVLDNVMKEKRAEGLDHFLAQYSDDAVQKVLQDGKVRKPKKREQEDRPGEVLSDTIRSRLAMIRADVNQGLDRKDREKLKRMEAMIKRHSWLVYLAIALAVGLVLLWIAFGCYGIYTFFYPTAQHVQTRLARAFPVHSRPTAENEIVIRLVREVVHTDPQGVIIDRSPEQLQLSRERIDKIAACMSQSLDEEL